jgi:predicted transposase YbfD/YdcC
VTEIQGWPGLETIIRVESQREIRGEYTYQTRWHISSLIEDAKGFYHRIRGHWEIENKVHYVKDVTQGEDSSRIRKNSLPQTMASVRNFVLNLYRSQGFTNMAQAQRYCKPRRLGFYV